MRCKDCANPGRYSFPLKRGLAAWLCRGCWGVRPASERDRWIRWDPTVG